MIFLRSSIFFELMLIFCVGLLIEFPHLPPEDLERENNNSDESTIVDSANNPKSETNSHSINKSN